MEEQEYVYTVDIGEKTRLETGETKLSFVATKGDIDKAYGALAEALIFIRQDEVEAEGENPDYDEQLQKEVRDFQNAKDTDVKTLLDDMQRMGFIGFWEKEIEED